MKIRNFTRSPALRLSNVLHIIIYKYRPSLLIESTNSTILFVVLVHCTFQSLFCNSSGFIVDPEDITVEINDTDVELTCTPGLETDQIIIWEIFLRNGTLWTVTESDPDVQLRR